MFGQTTVLHIDRGDSLRTCVNGYWNDEYERLSSFIVNNYLNFVVPLKNALIEVDLNGLRFTFDDSEYVLMSEETNIKVQPSQHYLLCFMAPKLITLYVSARRYV